MRCLPTALLAAALLTTGCISVTSPVPSASPQAGTAIPLPTALPAVATAAPTEQPLPTAASGTPWMTFLGWAMAATEEMLPIWERGETDLLGSAQAGLPIVRRHLGWLHGHPPQPCYAVLHAATLDQYGRAEAAFTAIETGDFGNAVALMQAALDATTRVNELIPTTGCN